MINSDPYAALLWVVVGWPLLLAIPAVRRCLPMPDYLATLPALLLLLLPMDFSSTLSWLLLGTGVSIDGERRWILATVVLIWVLAAMQRRSPSHIPLQGQNIFYLLTLAGSLGVVLASDRVGFFSFATLMGYSFYGLLLWGQRKPVKAVQRGARHYLICLIIADLLLFEALLLAAFNPQMELSRLYLLMVFGAVVLKAGIWPAHFWLSASYRAASRFSALLLVLPVVMALFALVRWLPLGQVDDGAAGLLFLITAGASILYVGWRSVQRTVRGESLARASGFVSGLLLATVGLGVIDSLWWSQFDAFIYPLIAAIGVILSMAALLRPQRASTSQPSDATLRVGTWWIACSALSRKLFAGYCLWYNARLARVKQLWHGLERWDLIGLLSSWRNAITLFVLLGISLAWLAG